MEARRQGGGRVSLAADAVCGVMSQGSARGSKKRPAALAMAAVGALGGIALARRRRAAAANEPLEASGLPSTPLASELESGRYGATGVGTAT